MPPDFARPGDNPDNPTVTIVRTYAVRLLSRLGEGTPIKGDVTRAVRIVAEQLRTEIDAAKAATDKTDTDTDTESETEGEH